MDREIENIMVDDQGRAYSRPARREALERAEAERTTLLHTVQGQQKNIAKVAAFLPDAIGRFKALITDLANVTQRHVDLARAQLRLLLGQAIVLASVCGWRGAVSDGGSDGGLYGTHAAGDRAK